MTNMPRPPSSGACRWQTSISGGLRRLESLPQTARQMQAGSRLCGAELPRTTIVASWRLFLCPLQVWERLAFEQNCMQTIRDSTQTHATAIDIAAAIGIAGTSSSNSDQYRCSDQNRWITLRIISEIDGCMQRSESLDKKLQNDMCMNACSDRNRTVCATFFSRHSNNSALRTVFLQMSRCKASCMHIMVPTTSLCILARYLPHNNYRLHA